jgi:DNA repair protein RecO (recombination protein O)
VPRPTDTSDALFLRGVDYAESDRIVTLLTRRFGKASFIARAARRSKKRFAGALQPLQLISVELQHGATQLGSLARAEVVRTFPRVLSDLARMSAGFAALELVRELTPEHESDPALFGTTLDMLQALDTADIAPEPLALCFQARMLALTGFAPRLDACGTCGKRPASGQSAEFDPRAGHLVCQSCGGASAHLGGTSRALLQRASSAEWVACARAEWPAAEIPSARSALRAFIEYRIGKPLRASALGLSSEEPSR